MIADIAQVQQVEVTNLVPDSRNARKHNQRNIAAIKESLTRFGQVKPIVVSRSTGHIVAGNGTFRAAQELGWSHLSVVYVQGTEAELRALALADNRTAELAEWDFEELTAQVQELGVDSLLDLGWKDYELQPLLQAQWTPPAVDDNYQAPQPKPARPSGGGGNVFGAATSGASTEHTTQGTSSIVLHLDGDMAAMFAQVTELLSEREGRALSALEVLALMMADVSEAV